MKPAMAAILVMLLFALTACSQDAELKQQLNAQSTRIAQMEASSSHQPTASPDPTATVIPTASPTPSYTRAPIPRPPTSPTAVLDTSLTGQTRYVSADGIGVKLRNDCLDSAISGGAWADGTQVTIQYGKPSCLGWLVCEAQGSESWVRTAYLTAAKPTPLIATEPVAQETRSMYLLLEDYQRVAETYVVRGLTPKCSVIGPYAIDPSMEYAPGFEPGGAHAKVSANLGLPFTPIKLRRVLVECVD